MIQVEREHDDAAGGPPVFENCCFCRKPTAFWYTAKDVAVCLQCAETASPEDVPDKTTWLRRELIAEASDSLEMAIHVKDHKPESQYDVH
jgi:recombinational DNA repair protein (RecF pathway)